MQTLDLEKLGLTELSKEEMNKIWGGQLAARDVSTAEYGLSTEAVYPHAQPAASGLMSGLSNAIAAATRR